MQLTQADLATRRIGGSDAGTILGLNKYKNRHDLFLEKTGQVDPEFKETRYTEWGHRLEAPILAKLNDTLGLRAVEFQQEIYREDLPFMSGRPDAVDEETRSIVEIKTTSLSFTAYPDSWYAQVHHYMILTGYKTAYIACLKDGREFNWWEVQYDEEFAQTLIRAESEFWADVENFKAGNPVEERPIEPVDIHLTAELDASLVLEITDLEAESKVLEDRIKELKELVKKQLGNATIGKIGDATVATYNESARTAVDSKKLKEEYPDVYENVKKISRIRTLLIKKGGLS